MSITNLRFPAFDLAIAVSGGADSMALLHMAHVQKRTDQTLVALTVDHGLRSESGAEAEAVAAYCATLAIPHHTLLWTGDKPQTGLQAKARAARRKLLLDACRQFNITNLYLGHQADDQAEIFLQRLARGSSAAGLSGMRPVIIQDGIALHRPLLHLRRAELRAYCLQHNVPFHDDPSNDDTRYERIRWRQLVNEIEKTQPDFVTGVIRSQRRLHDAAQAIEQIAKTWLNANQIMDGDKILLPRALLAQQPHAVIVAILRMVMPSKTSHHVSLERLENWVAQAFDPVMPPIETALTLDGKWMCLKKSVLTVATAPARRTQNGKSS